MQPAVGQINFLGKPGVMTTPSASWEEEEQLGLSFSYIPSENSRDVFNFRNSLDRSDLNFYNLRIGLTTFLEIGLSLGHRPDLPRSGGIGERHLDFRLKILNERKFWPSIVVGITPPGSVAPVIAHDFLVATKNFKTNVGNINVTTGYGSPFVFIRQPDQGFFDITVIEKKDYYDSQYLTGFFASIIYSPVDFAGVMVEYNTNTVNAGAYIKLWDWLHLQGYTFEGKKAAFQIAGHFPLDFSPFALRKHKK